MYYYKTECYKIPDEILRDIFNVNESIDYNVLHDDVEEFYNDLMFNVDDEQNYIITKKGLITWICDNDYFFLIEQTENYIEFINRLLFLEKLDDITTSLHYELSDYYYDEFDYYVHEHIENIKELLPNIDNIVTFVSEYEEFERVLLNNQANWIDYSYAGCSLCYTYDICKHLCRDLEYSDGLTMDVIQIIVKGLCLEYEDNYGIFYGFDFDNEIEIQACLLELACKSLFRYIND